MKKLLALVLALVMTLSLCTISNAAYSDAADVDYKEAVDVMSAIGVLEGADGKFNPDGILTREQAAKIIAYMLLGKKAADSLSTTSAPFTDVAANRWSAGAIAYCASEGILAGVGDGKFDPTGTLTGYAFAKMCLTALGYKADVEGFTGSDWQINVAKCVLTANLDNDLSIAMTNGITRQEAAQMAFNTELATMVQYSSGVNVATSDGTKVTVNASRFYMPGSSAVNYDNNVTGDGYLQFCEQYAKDLKKSADTATGFGATAYKWMNAAVKVGKYAAEPAFVYTASMTSKAGNDTLKSDLSNYCTSGVAITVASANVLVNGAASTALTCLYDTVAANTPAAGDLDYLTGNGRIVEIYLNAAKTAIASVVVKEYDLYQVTTINANSSTITLTAKTGTTGLSSNSTVTVNKNGTNDDYFAELSKLAAKDYVILAVDTSNNILDVQYPTKVSGVYTKLNDGVYTVGGNEYKAAATNAVTMTQSSSTSYDLYLDTYGYILFTDTTSTTSTYAYVLNLAKEGTAASGYTYSAKLLLTDGSIAWKTVKKISGTTVGAENDSTYAAYFAAGSGDTNLKDHFVTYTENSDGSFNFTAVTNNDVNTITAIDNDNPLLASGKTANSKTVFLTKQVDGTYKSYTGIRNVPDITGITSGNVKMLTASGIVKVVVVENGSAYNSDSKYVYVYNNTPVGSYLDEDDNTVYTYKAIVDGAVTTIDTTLSSITGSLGMYYGVSVDENGYVSALGTEFAVSTTSSALGKKGNYAVDYSATNITLTLKDDTLTVTAGSGEIYKSSTATTATSVSGTTLGLSVAEGFVAYTVNENDTVAPCDVLSIGETTDVVGNITKDVIIICNADGEAVALYVLNTIV